LELPWKGTLELPWKAMGSFLGKENSVSIVKADRDGSSFDTADKDGSSFDGGFGGILVLCSFSGLRV
jgi:hypothetical protein